MGYDLIQSSASLALPFMMVSSTDGTTPLTGASPTVTISKNGGSFATPSGAVTEIGNGWYQVAGNATDTNTLGSLLLHATATGGDPSDDMFRVVAFNALDGVRGGLTALPNVAAGTAGGLATATNSSGQVTASSVTGAVGSVTGAVGSVTGNVGGISGVTLPATVPSLAQMQAGLPTDASIATDVQTGLTAQGYTTARAGFLDTLNGLVADVWANATRTLTSMSDSSGVTTLLSRIGQALLFDGSGNVKSAPQTTVTLASSQAFNNTGQSANLPATVEGYASGQDPGTIVFGESVESGLTFLQFCRAVEAALVGDAGVSSGTVSFKRKDGTTTAWSVTFDSSGNRSASTQGTL
ncbi:MAG TPA: hypothetical protein VFW40_08660 [Capsulimonadaceae bacterium]|nr:hypothetical protein [Capsulimonadaceae bacterium]